MQIVEDNVRHPARRRHVDAASSVTEAHTGPEGEFTMQQVVALTGVGEHALRFYERMGVLPRVQRQRSSGHRRYTVADILTIQTLACLRAAGMPLAQMRQYLDLVPQGAAAAPQAQRILAEQRAELEAQMQMLQERLAYLDHKVAYWNAVAAHDQQAVDRLAQKFAAGVRAIARNRQTPSSRLATPASR